MLGAGVLGGAIIAATHRYWRIQVVAGFEGYQTWETFFQISFFSSVDGTGTDLCLGKTASALTSYPGFPASLANDNNAGTRWANNQSGSPPTWWKIDLGSGNDAQIHSAKLLGFVITEYYFATKWDLQWSDNNTDWTTQTRFNVAQTAALQTISNL